MPRTPSARPSTPETAAGADPKRIIFTYEQDDSGLTYKKQSALSFRGGISYQVDFTATPGTFAANLPVFTAFCDAIEFFESARPVPVEFNDQQEPSTTPGANSEENKHGPLPDHP